MRVYVYYNLHKKMWSIKALDGPSKGLVVRHSTVVLLQDCEFKVSEAGRQRVLREQKKNVHAGVVGTLVALSGEKTWFPFPVSKEVTYNPYKYETFVYKAGEKPIKNCARVLMTALTRPVVRAA